MNKEELIRKIREEIKPRQRLGQNFLINPRVYEKIIETAGIEKGENVLEIGSGTGVLTRYLIDTEASVTAVEKDQNLIPKLKENAPEAKIIGGDILKIDLAKLGLKGNGYKIVANIPYYLTSRLIRHIFEKWPKPRLIVLMVQYEVALRITAKPPKMNLLALSVQFYSEPKIIMRVKKGNFWPMPDVDSAIIRLKPREKTEKLEKQLFSLAKTAFMGKRKKLGNTLKTYKKQLAELGIDPDRRPETLTLEEWQKLAKSISSQSSAD